MISLAIIADIRLYREGLAEVLGREPDIRVVGTASGDEAGIRRVVRAAPDVALLDIAMSAGAEIARTLGGPGAGIAVLALGVPETESHVLACAEVGAAGYVPREGSLQDLLDGVRQVARGEACYSPRLVATLLRRFAAGDGPRHQAVERLTARELEIVTLIDRGLTNKEIAAHLYIELATVKNHVHNILEKLGLHGRAEAAAWMRAQRGISSRRLGNVTQLGGWRADGDFGWGAVPGGGAPDNPGQARLRRGGPGAREFRQGRRARPGSGRQRPPRDGQVATARNANARAGAATAVIAWPLHPAAGSAGKRKPAPYPRNRGTAREI